MVHIKQDDFPGQVEDFELPPWTGLTKSWYRSLNRAAREYKIPRKTILEEALKTYLKILKGNQSPFRQLKTAQQGEEAVKNFFGKFSRDWWESLTPEQKEAESQKRKKAANARWDKKRKKTK